MALVMGGKIVWFARENAPAPGINTVPPERAYLMTVAMELAKELLSKPAVIALSIVARTVITTAFVIIVKLAAAVQIALVQQAAAVQLWYVLLPPVEMAYVKIRVKNPRIVRKTAKWPRGAVSLFRFCIKS